MAIKAAPPNAREIRSVTRDVADADNTRVLRVVATVDAMAARGTADQLIAPLRPRLAVLRPPRPLRFVRLMFYPLDPLIVPAGRWRPDRNAIPRTALAPMADCVRSSMGAEAQAIEAAIVGRTTADADLIVSRGHLLWAAAGRVLIGASAPPTWAETGLAVALFAPLARRVGALLSQMAAFDRLCAETADGLLPLRAEALHAILRGLAELDETALPMMVSLLLTRLPEAVALLATGQPASQGAAMKAAVEQTVGALLEQLAGEDGAGARIAATSLAEAASAVRRIATLLRELEDGSVTPARRAQLNAARQNLDAGCRARFAAGLRDHVLAPLSEAALRDIAGTEAAARDLRALETEARTVGGASTYDLMLRQAAEAIKAAPAGDGLERSDQLRLVEILAGPDAALAMLDERRGGQ
jgi:hypothetical protein